MSKLLSNCNIKILEKEYSINCHNDEIDILQKSAEFLNEKIKQTRENGNVSGSEKILVMTALNIVYDLLQSSVHSDDFKVLNKKLCKLNQKLEKTLSESQQIELNH